MTMQTGQQAPVTSNTPPAVAADPDAAKYEALRQELNIEPDAPEPEAAPEPAPAPAKVEPEPEPAKTHVPYAEHENVQRALREAREQSKAAETRFSKALEVLAQRGQSPAEPKKDEAPKIPDKLEDPIGHYDARIAQLEAQLKQAHEGTQQTAQQLQADQQLRQFQDVVVRAEQEINDPKSQSYKADYWDAVTHLEAQRIAELEQLYPDGQQYAEQMARHQGFESAAHLRAAVLHNDKGTVAAQALQMGVSPAEFYYKLAFARGYQPKAQQTQRAPNGQFVPADKGKQQIEAAKRGKAASVSISGGDGGRKGAQDMSIADLANLAIEDPDAFDKAWAEMQRLGRLG